MLSWVEQDRVLTIQGFSMGLATQLSSYMEVCLTHLYFVARMVACSSSVLAGGLCIMVPVEPQPVCLLLCCRAVHCT